MHSIVVTGNAEEMHPPLPLPLSPSHAYVSFPPFVKHKPPRKEKCQNQIMKMYRSSKMLFKYSLGLVHGFCKELISQFCKRKAKGLFCFRSAELPIDEQPEVLNQEESSFLLGTQRRLTLRDLEQETVQDELKYLLHQSNNKNKFLETLCQHQNKEIAHWRRNKEYQFRAGAPCHLSKRSRISPFHTAGF